MRALVVSLLIGLIACRTPPVQPRKSRETHRLAVDRPRTHPPRR